MAQATGLSRDQITALIARQRKIAALKGQNPTRAFFANWTEQEVNDALVYGELTPGCMMLLTQVQAHQQARYQPAATSAANSTKAFRLSIVTAIIAVLALLTTLGFLFKWF